MTNREVLPKGFSEALDVVASNHDTAHQIHRLNYDTVKVAATASAFAFVVAGEMSALPYDGVVALAYYAIGRSAMHLGVKIKQLRGETERLNRAAPAQIEAQASFAQPIDVLRAELPLPIRLPGGPRYLNLRWYGFDKGYHSEDFEPKSNLGEFRQLVAMTKREDVDGIIVSTSILEDLPTKTKYNPLPIDGQHLVHKQITDPFADKELLYLRPASAQILLDTLSEQVRADAIVRLIEIFDAYSPNNKISIAYQRLQNDNTPQNQADLERAISREIETRESGDTTKLKLRSENGWGYVSHKASASGRVVGSELHTIHQAQITMQRELLDAQPGQNLLGRLGIKSVDTLLHKIDNDQIPSSKLIEYVEVGLWYLLGPAQLREQTTYQMISNRNQLEARRPLQPSLQTRILNERPQGRWHVQPHGAGVDETTATLIYHRPPRPKILSNILSMALVSTVGSTFGVALDHGAEQHYQSTMQYLQQRPDNQGIVNNETTNKYLLHHAWKPNNLGTLGAHALGSVNQGIQSKINSGLHDLHIPSFLYGGGNKGKGTSGDIAGSTNTYNNSGSNSYSDLDSNAGFGNTPVSPNRTVWRIKSLRSANSGGYWVESIESELLLDHVSANSPTALAPFNNETLTAQDDNLRLSTVQYVNPKPSLTQSEEPLLRVSTPGSVRLSSIISSTTPNLPQNDGAGVMTKLNVPFLSDSSLEAARLLIGSTSQHKEEVPVFVAYSSDGTDKLLAPYLKDKASEQVHLTYWLKPHGNGNFLPHATTPMGVAKIGEKHYENLLDRVSSKEATAIWDAEPNVKGPIPRSAPAVAETIRQHHQFASQPLGDNVSNNSIAGKDLQDGGAVQAIGKLIASNLETNPNLADLQELFITRGINGSLADPLNLTTGYNVPAYAKRLTVDDSSIGVIDGRGVIMNPTPPENRPIITQPHHNAVDPTIALEILASVALLSAVGGGSAVGKLRRRRQANSELDARTPEEAALLRQHYEWLGDLLYANKDKYAKPEQINDRAAKRRDFNVQRDAPKRNFTNTKEVKRRLSEAQKQGQLTMSRKQRAEFLRFADNLHITRRRQSKGRAYRSRQ